jgi:hypothetical protein
LLRAARRPSKGLRSRSWRCLLVVVDKYAL